MFGICLALLYQSQVSPVIVLFGSECRPKNLPEGPLGGGLNPESLCCEVRNPNPQREVTQVIEIIKHLSPKQNIYIYIIIYI